MEEIFSLNKNLLIHNDVSLNGNLNVKNIITQDLSVNNILKTNNLDIYGNLNVFGNQTIINSEVLNVDDNIIIVNADGKFIQQAGLQANINGNLYGFLYDNNINAWTINNKNLHLNKLVGNNIELTNNVIAQWFNGNLSGTNVILKENVTAQWFNGNLSGTNAYLSENITAQWLNGNLSGTNAHLSNNVTAQWFNGNLSGTNANLTETLTANTIHVNELHLSPNTLYIDNEAILYKHNGNLLMSVNHFHGDLTGNLISKNTFVNGNIIIGNNFGIKFNDGTTITSGNITSSSGGGGTSNVTPEEIDERISNYLFNRPEAPTDSSYNFRIITDNTRAYPTITLKWSNPITKRVAFSFGTTSGYNTPVTGNFINDFSSNINITHLPYSKELLIQYREENENLWANLTLHSDGTSIPTPQYTIPNTVITANFNNSNDSPTLIANTISHTYTEFKSGKILIIGKSYQFRIYLTNEITEEDASYNYLYIPSETEYIAFGGFANVTAPTEILFPEKDFYNLQIKGINGNIYAETGMNTTFPIPDSYELRVRYGFNIDISANVNSKQMPNKRGSSNSGSFITENLRNSNFIENINFASGLKLPNEHYINWYPEFDYNVSNFFMEANLDIVGNIAQTTIGNSITTLMPSRVNVGAATSFFNGLPTQDYTSLFSSNNFGMTKSNIYSYVDDTLINNIYILDSTQSFDLTFNPNINKVINNSNDYIGIDSSGVDLCNFTSNIINHDNTLRYTDITNYSEGFLEITNINSNANIIVTGSIGDGSTYNNTKGYYTDINLTQLGVKNIQLSRFPDIYNNNYEKYRVNVNQNVNYSNGFQNEGTIYFDFGVAEKSASDITGLHNLVAPEVTLDNNFFGLKRPNNSTSININYTLTLSNINEFWRSNLNIINTLDLKYNHNSINLDSISSTDKVWNSNSNTNINPNLSINPSNLWYNTSNNTLLYSRNFIGTHQLEIKYNINNNIGRSQTTRESSIDFGFGSTSRILWWDYTWGINNGPPSNFFSTTPSSAKSSLQFINAVGNNIFSSNTTFDHGTILADNQLMWANGGFRSGGISQSDNNNPYINYTNFYNPSNVLHNYESKKTSGDNISYNYTPSGGRQWWNNTSLNGSLSTFVKFITFNIEMPYKESISGDGNIFIFTININSLNQISSPTNINGFLIFHTEKNTSNITSGPYDGQSVFAIENNIGSHNGNTSNPGYVIRNTSSDTTGPKTTLQISVGIPNNLNINMQQLSIGFQKIS